MTVVLCYNTDCFSIIATDTRMMSRKIPVQGKPPNDNNYKLFEMNNGWGAGAGCSELINDVLIKTRQARLSTQEEMRKLYSDCIIDHIKRIRYPANELNDTAIAISELIYGSLEKMFVPQIHVYSLLRQFEPTIDKNMLFILYPVEYIKNIDLVKELHCHFDMKLGNDLNQCVYKMCDIFNAIQMSSDCVSKTCDIGIISIENNRLCQIRIRDIVNNIIRDVSNGFQNAELYKVTYTEY